MSKIQLTELDFAQIKENFRDYLRSQSQFEDYDLEGSGMSVLMDILAYNTSYLAYYLHMVANEMFLDTAVLRKNVVSRAKAIGYTPTSRRSAKAVIRVEVFPGDAPSSITVPEGTRFSTNIDGRTYYFSTYDTYTIPLSGGRYVLDDIVITEGHRLTHRFTIDGSTLTPSSVLRLPNAGVDTSLLKVRVQTSSVDTTTAVYKLADGITELDSESNVFFLQEGEGLTTEIYFGDGIIGKSLEDGNIVIVDYTVSNGSLVNLASSFQAVQNVGGYTNVIVSLNAAAAGGSDEEEIESIKFLAPLNYQSQDRAVTKTDYEVLIKKDFPAIDAVRVWGGEENVPPQYGKVFISLKPSEGLVLSNSLKDYITQQLIKKRNMVSVEVVIVDPDYIYLVIDSTVRYRSQLTNDSSGVIQQAIVDAIVDFGESNLNMFDSYFRYSKMVRDIDASHTSIQNSMTSIKLKYRLFPSFDAEEKHQIAFGNAVDSSLTTMNTPTLSSTGFTYNGFTCYFQDNQEGVIQIYRLVEGSRVIVQSNAGTIDYSTGDVVIDRLLISGTASGDDYVEIMVCPLFQDISTVRNQIIVVDEDNINVTLIDESTTF